MLKRILCTVIICAMIFGAGQTARAEYAGFSDVPSDSWAKEDIATAAALGIMSGTGGHYFGYGRVLTRAEFAAMLPRLFGWRLVSPDLPTFADNSDKNSWYYDDIETAVANGAVLASGTQFRPKEPITREEMAVMLVRALGYETLAGSLKSIRTPFTDVTSNLPYIAMAFDFGIIKGSSSTTFNPNGSATREVAATMMVRLYDSYYSKTKWSHSFYAISSYAQKEMIPAFDAISFGWSRLEINNAGIPVLNTTSANGNAYSMPSGYQEVVQMAKQSGVPNNLSVYMSTSQKVTLPDGTLSNACNAVLNDEGNRSQAVALILAELTRDHLYSGVTIDFEEMRGDTLKSGLSLFLQALRDGIQELGLSLYVCVPPVTSDGVYYDGYDYKTIGAYADKVILMAHDYAAKTLSGAEMSAGFTSTPVSPIYEIYTALQAITDSVNGVQDKSKIVLAVSFNSIQWKLKDGKVINSTALQPDAALLYARMLDPSAVLNYSVKYQNPYIMYHNSTDNTDNIGWYEDARSIDAKVDLARMFGVTGISIWRLGLIPDYDDTTDRLLFYDIPAWLASQK